MPSTRTKVDGEAVSYQDAFYLQNVEESTEFFVHVDTRALKANDDE